MPSRCVESQPLKRESRGRGQEKKEEKRDLQEPVMMRFNSMLLHAVCHAREAVHECWPRYRKVRVGTKVGGIMD